MFSESPPLRETVSVRRLQYLLQQRNGSHKPIGRASEDQKCLKEKLASLDGHVLEAASNLTKTIDLKNERKLDVAE